MGAKGSSGNYCCSECDTRIRCHPCCKCIPQSLCVTLEAPEGMCTCFENKSQEIGWDCNTESYHGVIICGDLNIDVEFTLEIDGSSFEDCYIYLTSVCMNYVGTNRLRQGIINCGLSASFTVDTHNCGDTNCGSATLSIKRMPKVEQKSTCLQAADCIDPFGCCISELECPDPPANPGDDPIEPENGWPLFLYGTITAVTENCSCLDGRVIVFERLSCFAPETPTYQGQLNHDCPQNPDPLRIALRCCDADTCGPESGQVFKAISNACQGDYQTTCPSGNDAVTSSCSPLQFEFDEVVVLGCCEENPTEPNELVSLVVTE